MWQWCICPSQAAPLAQGGVLDGWRAGWARPDEGTRAMLWRSVWGWVLGGVGTCGGRGGGRGGGVGGGTAEE